MERRSLIAKVYKKIKYKYDKSSIFKLLDIKKEFKSFKVQMCYKDMRITLKLKLPHMRSL